MKGKAYRKYDDSMTAIVLLRCQSEIALYRRVLKSFQMHTIFFYDRLVEQLVAFDRGHISFLSNFKYIHTFPRNVIAIQALTFAAQFVFNMSTSSKKTSQSGPKYVKTRPSPSLLMVVLRVGDLIYLHVKFLLPLPNPWPLNLSWSLPCDRLLTLHLTTFHSGWSQHFDVPCAYFCLQQQGCKEESISI